MPMSLSYYLQLPYHLHHYELHVMSIKMYYDTFDDKARFNVQMPEMCANITGQWATVDVPGQHEGNIQ